MADAERDVDLGGRFQPILEFERRPMDQPWLWREARLRDPDGNWLCLFNAGGEQTQSAVATGRDDAWYP
ncbi:MAG TPA: hypothetical protein VFB39_10820 [Solirubrobacteraceae bacterium]|nr:hypothetical protein [Solirubrobacteraceae bacterium]